MSFSLPRLTSVVVITACEREVSDDTLNGVYVVYCIQVIFIIQFMTKEAAVNNVFDV